MRCAPDPITVSRKIVAPRSVARLATAWDNRYLDSEVPIALRVLGERTGAKRVITETVRIPHAEVDTGKADGIPGPLGGPALEGHPAERTALASAAAPTQPALAGSLPLGGVLVPDLVDGRRADQVELLAGAPDERSEVEAGEETTFTTENLNLVRVAGVPNCVDLERHAVKHRDVTVLDPDLERLDRDLRTAATRHGEIIAKTRHAAGRFSSPP